MKQFIGTKIINAKPMYRLAYNQFRGWPLPADENGDDDGYLVEYTDGGKPNTAQYAGYVSWSPKEQFEKAYKEAKTITRSYVCGTTCSTGSKECNGYCKDQKIKSPGTYEIAMLDFSTAIHALKDGKKVARVGWNGNGMFVFLVNGSTFNVNRAPLLGIFTEGTEINYRPHIDIKGVDGSISTWVPSIGDVMAEDWQLVD